MRKILWNLYALPFMLMAVLSYASIINGQPFWLTALDFCMSLPGLTALFFHIWRIKSFYQAVWKAYAFVIVCWDIFYNLVLIPAVTGKPADAAGYGETLIILLPLYIAVFRYAFVTMQQAGPPAAASSGAHDRQAP